MKPTAIASEGVIHPPTDRAAHVASMKPTAIAVGRTLISAGPTCTVESFAAGYRVGVCRASLNVIAGGKATTCWSSVERAGRA